MNFMNFYTNEKRVLFDHFTWRLDKRLISMLDSNFIMKDSYDLRYIILIYQRFQFEYFC